MSINNYGIWIGKDSTIAITEYLTIAFLRLKEDLIVSILRYNEKGVIGVAYGHGNSSIGKQHTHTAVIICDGYENVVKNNDEANDFIALHSLDKISYNAQTKTLFYTTYDNMVFENLLAEKIEMDDFTRENEIDNSISITEKMSRWNIKHYIQLNEKQVRAGIDTRKYSIFYNIELDGNRYDEKYNEFIYCRVGQMGYCEKGHAMLPTIQIRHHMTSMNNDNMSSINDYHPNEDWFVDNSCAFPEDGGWYWAIKEINDDIIYLQGCGGDIYGIPRIKYNE